MRKIVCARARLNCDVLGAHTMCLKPLSIHSQENELEKNLHDWRVVMGAFFHDFNVVLMLLFIDTYRSKEWLHSTHCTFIRRTESD